MKAKLSGISNWVITNSCWYRCSKQSKSQALCWSQS